VAVELDDALAEALPQKVPGANLRVVHEDVLKFDFTALSTNYKVVANIPYYLTSHLIRIISETTNPPSRSVLLVQKEVAERVAAKPGQLSLLAVTTQYYNQVSLGPIVSAKLFMPPPKVDSRILILDRRAKPLFGDIDTRLFFQMVKAGFSQRRKTLLNSLSAGLQRDREATIELLRRAGIDPRQRAQALSLDQWYSLYQNT
jgi:16S rRNA (adenine1518-N6/adenine1519-N6)-dimethyltransferase